MDKLNNVEAYQIVNNMLNRNDMQIDENTKNRIVDIYSSLMNNESNKYKSLEIQKSMIEDIVYSKIKNEDERFIFQRYSDVKHLEYLDIFAGVGESQKLLDILREEKIPVDVLKGIKYKLNMNEEKVGNGVEITQTFDENSPPELERFEVKYKGKTIYLFEGKIEEQFKFDKSLLNEEQQEELRIKKQQDYEYIKKIKEKISKSKRKSTSKGVFHAVNEEDIEYIEDAEFEIVEQIEFKVKQKPRKAFRDVKTGRFISMKDKKLF